MRSFLVFMELDRMIMTQQLSMVLLYLSVVNKLRMAKMGAGIRH